MKPILKVRLNKFVDFMTDENGVDICVVADTLKGGESFTVKHLLDTCGYIPSNLIVNKRTVPKVLRDNAVGSDFEVQPTDFKILFV